MSTPAHPRWLTWPIRHPWWTLLLCMVVNGALAIPASQVRSDNSSKIFELAGDPDQEFFDAYKEAFDTHDFFVVTMTCGDLFTRENLTILTHLTDWLGDLEGVEKATSLANVEDIRGGAGEFLVEPFLEELPEDAAGLAALRQRALSKPLYRRGVVSEDGRTAGIIVEMAEGATSDAARARLVEAVQDHLRPLSRPGRSFAVAGRQVTDYYLGAYLNRDMGRLMPLCVAIMLVILLLLFRHPLGILLPSLLVGCAMTGGMAALVLVGGTNNMVTSILPALMMATGIGLAIHLLTDYHEQLLTAALPMGEAAPTPPEASVEPAPGTAELMEQWQGRLTGEVADPEATEDTAGGDPALTAEIAAWLDRLGRIDHLARHNTLIVTHVVGELWRPCLAAILTTMAGFGSLAISHVPPIRHFGIAAAAGAGYTLVMAFTLLPALLVIIRRPISRRHAEPIRTDLLDDLLGSIARLVTRHPRPILLGAGLIAAVAAAGMARLRVETNGLEFFFPDAPPVTQTLEVERRLAGTEDLRISLKGDEPNAMLSLAAVEAQEGLESWLRERPEVDKVVGLPDYLKAMNRAFHDDDPSHATLPDSADLIAQYMLLYDGEEIRDVLTDDASWASLNARVHVHGVAELKGLVEATEARLATLSLPGKARTTGHSLLSVNLIDAIMGAQIQSLALASLLIFAMVAAIFRSLRDGLIAMPPNLLPILLNLGLMGWVGIPLNPATAMISAVAIGIAVDDTVHFLSEYRATRTKGGSPIEAIRHTQLLRGRAMVSTSVVLFFAFVVLVVSSFMPVVHFGLLTATTMVSALLADLFFLPALLTRLESFPAALPPA